MRAEESHPNERVAVASDAIGSLWLDIQRLLDQHKARLYEEIRNYPTPIAGCDQQFNYLLESQAELARDLQRLQQAATRHVADARSGGRDSRVRAVISLGRRGVAFAHSLQA